ncbi:MAG: hypothetical protein Hals2KO_37150 [Halioglobus sp.]
MLVVLRARTVPVTKIGSDRFVYSGLAVVTFTGDEVAGVFSAFLSSLGGSLSQPVSIDAAKTVNIIVTTSRCLQQTTVRTKSKIDKASSLKVN